MSQLDERAKEWDTPENREQAAYVADVIRSVMSLSTETSAFEYGASTGLLSFELRNDIGSATIAVNSDKGFKILNEEISSHSVDNIKPVRFNLSEDPLPNDQFNLVYTMLPLRHIREAGQLFSTFYKLLGNGGFLCLADLELDKKDTSFSGYGTDVAHEVFDQNEVASMTKKAGFKDISLIQAPKWSMRLIKAQRNAALYF